jgi:hypothetical protein
VFRVTVSGGVVEFMDNEGAAVEDVLAEEEATYVVIGGIRVFADGSYCRDYGLTA